MGMLKIAQALGPDQAESNSVHLHMHCRVEPVQVPTSTHSLYMYANPVCIVSEQGFAN